jgi:glycosyltransferase involved in cell wall biosynthesis
LGWDYGKPYLKLDGVKVYYVNRSLGKIKRYINFISECVRQCRVPQDVVFIKYFPLCFIVKFLAKKNIYILDIRTGFLVKNPIMLSLMNTFLSWEVKLFKNITIISSSLANKLALSKREPKVIPLGADIVSRKCKSFNELKLLYVGTFHLRNLEKTILGFAKFYRKYNSQINMNYIIIGSGYNQEEERYEALIKKERLEKVITLMGPIYHEDLKTYFDSQNIGVSFVPMTSYFDCQPSTKTFEYLLSGMPVIATATFENTLVVDDSNGVLINDTADDFCEGLKKMANSRDTYNSERMRTKSKQYTWETIIQDELKEYLLKLV